MTQKISHISIVVDDYDHAIEFYTKKLNFVLLEDTLLSETKRWVRVAPNPLSEFSLLLAKAANDVQQSRIGNQTGGRVFLFLNTNDFESDYQNLLHHNIRIIREPTREPYGKVLVFEDCYGNLWDLIEPIEKQNEKFYSTGILKVLDKRNIEKAKMALIELRRNTRIERGNIRFDIQQSKEDPAEFIIWECFENDIAFQKHLHSRHFKDFHQLGLVEFVKGYAASSL